MSAPWKDPGKWEGVCFQSQRPWDPLRRSRGQRGDRRRERRSTWHVANQRREGRGGRSARGADWQRPPGVWTGARGAQAGTGAGRVRPPPAGVFPPIPHPPDADHKTRMQIFRGQGTFSDGKCPLRSRPAGPDAHCARPPEDPVGIKARGAWSHTGAKALGRVCSCSGPHPSSSSLPAPLSPDSLPVSPRAHPASERCPSSSPLRMVGVPPPRRAQTSGRNVIIMTR